jgi:hypothetical protein
VYRNRFEQALDLGLGARKDQLQRGTAARIAPLIPSISGVRGGRRARPHNSVLPLVSLGKVGSPSHRISPTDDSQLFWSNSVTFSKVGTDFEITCAPRDRCEGIAMSCNASAKMHRVCVKFRRGCSVSPSQEFRRIRISRESMDEFVSWAGSTFGAPRRPLGQPASGVQCEGAVPLRGLGCNLHRTERCTGRLSICHYFHSMCGECRSGRPTS